MYWTKNFYIKLPGIYDKYINKEQVQSNFYKEVAKAILGGKTEKKVNLEEYYTKPVCHSLRASQDRKQLLIIRNPRDFG